MIVCSPSATLRQVDKYCLPSRQQGGGLHLTLTRTVHTYTHTHTHTHTHQYLLHAHHALTLPSQRNLSTGEDLLLAECVEDSIQPGDTIQAIVPGVPATPAADRTTPRTLLLDISVTTSSLTIECPPTVTGAWLLQETIRQCIRREITDAHHIIGLFNVSRQTDLVPEELVSVSAGVGDKLTAYHMDCGGPVMVAAPRPPFSSRRRLRAVSSSAAGLNGERRRAQSGQEGGYDSIVFSKERSAERLRGMVASTLNFVECVDAGPTGATFVADVGDGASNDATRADGSGGVPDAEDGDGGGGEGGHEGQRRYCVKIVGNVLPRGVRPGSALGVHDLRRCNRRWRLIQNECLVLCQLPPHPNSELQEPGVSWRQ